MKNLMCRHWWLAALSVSNVFGCIAVDDNRNNSSNDCAQEVTQAISPQDACAARGMTYIPSCPDGAAADECVEVTYHANPDCMVLTETVLCRASDLDCVIPPVSPQQACENEGFVYSPNCAAGWDGLNCIEISYQAGGDCGETIASTSCEAGPIACAIPPVSPHEVCEELGLTLVDECAPTGGQTNCRPVTYRVGGDCGEATAEVFCANIEHCVEPTVALPPPCEENGLETIIDESECDVIIPINEAGDVTEVFIENEQESTDQFETETGCVEVESEDGNTHEVGCEEPEATSVPQSPKVCFSLTTVGFCGQIGAVVCAERTPVRFETCEEANCPVGTRCELREIYEDCGPDCHSSVPVEIAECVPDACPEIYSPVCGVDGITYDNACFAGPIDIAHGGECGGGPPTTSCEELGLISDGSGLDVRVLFGRDRNTNAALTTVQIDFSVLGPYGIPCDPDTACLPVADHILAFGVTVSISAPNNGMRRVLSSDWDAPLESESLNESTMFELEGHHFGTYRAELALSINGRECTMTETLQLLDDP